MELNKKSYVAPKVARLGGLTDLTQAMTTGGTLDGGMNGGMVLS